MRGLAQIDDGSTILGAWRGEGPRGRGDTSRGHNATTAQARQRWGVKPPTDLFQGGGRAVLCCLYMVLHPPAPHLQGSKPLLHRIAFLLRKHQHSASTFTLLLSLLSSVIFHHVLKVELSTRVGLNGDVNVKIKCYKVLADFALHLCNFVEFLAVKYRCFLLLKCWE